MHFRPSIRAHLFDGIGEVVGGQADFLARRDIAFVRWSVPVFRLEEAVGYCGGDAVIPIALFVSASTVSIFVETEPLLEERQRSAGDCASFRISTLSLKL